MLPFFLISFRTGENSVTDQNLIITGTDDLSMSLLA